MKKLLITLSVILIIAGLAIVFIALATNGFNFAEAGKENTVTENYYIDEDFSKISANGLGAYDIKIEPSAEEKCEIIYVGHKDILLERSVKDGTLTLELNDTRNFFLRLFSFTERLNITLRVPEKAYEKISVSTASGDVKLDGLSVGSLEIDVSSGKVLLSSLTANNISLDSSSGNISIKKTTVSGKIKAALSSGDIIINDSTAAEFEADTSSGDVELESFKVTKAAIIDVSSGEIELNGSLFEKLVIDTSSGDVEFNRSDANEINIDTSSGDVEGTLLTGKMFDVRTSSGEARYPSDSAGGGKCYIRTSSGDIEIRIAD